jgi:hypothetical protein
MHRLYGALTEKKSQSLRDNRASDLMGLGGMVKVGFSVVNLVAR